MAIKELDSCNNGDHHEDFIDIELSSYSNFLCYSINSPPQSKEFEFQTCSVSNDIDGKPTNSPADDLFYKGKLLPLHLPRRLQMLQQILHSSTFEQNSEDINTHLESYTISPCESGRLSGDLNPDEHFFEWSIEVSSFISDHSTTSLSRKLKKFSLAQKLKASRAYIKSLFSKSGCPNESSTKATSNAKPDKPNESLNKYTRMGKRNPFGRTDCVYKTNEREMVDHDIAISQRRSFSGHYATKSSSCSSSTSSSGSSSFSFSSNGHYDLQLLKRSSSANSEVENSIEGAIAHCKQSQHLFNPRKAAS
ncbi:probable membrane-associated kinase regulator 3 [Carica papaya]|uniref:probable membrane-associated kinase regulator 3 n=1 Tax=Carica papaya TaxID=3649 RepID=UPI000B8D1BEF|nr:probable membrane-associated kinase regulator 3 [Carica papaya]